jgi:CheY-like chemotaxis protein
METLAKKVFVVDDDPFHLDLMVQLLKLNGYNEVTPFRSGLECLASVYQNPEIIFLDHQMDVYSGYEILKKIKRFNPNIFVVIVSAQEEINIALNTLKHGAFDYIQKDGMLGININMVLDRIEEMKEIIQTNKPSLFKSLLSFI